MSTTKVISLSVVMALPIMLSGCEGLFSDSSSPKPNNAPQSYYNYSDDNTSSDGASRSYGSGGNISSSSSSSSRSSTSSARTSKPRSDRPSTSSTADSIEDSAAVPIEPPSLD